MKPPRILADCGLIPHDEIWYLLRPLYGLREAPKFWEKSRDRVLSNLTFKVGGETVRLVQSSLESPLWALKIGNKTIGLV